jgi:hypothetical protein
LSQLQQLPQLPVQREKGAGPLADFYGFFPALETLPGALAHVYVIAEKAGINLDKGEYRLIASPEERLTRYEAVFPVRGNYTQVRAFAVSVLHDLPFASLDDLKLEKKRAEDTVLDSQIKLTFYLRPK